MLPQETAQESQKLPSHLLLGAVALLVVGGLIGFFVGQNVLKQTPTVATRNNESQNQTRCLDDLEKTMSKLQYCYSDRAEIGVTTREPYSFETFGVYSPLLEGSTVEVTEFNYKEEIITQKTARVVATDGTESTVEVWMGEQRGASQFIDDEYTNFPTFGGYENVGNPIYIRDIMKDWDKQTYTSKSGYKFHYSYYYAPEGITSVILDYVTSPFGSSIMVRIYQPIGGDEYADADQHDTPAIREAKAKLRALADTVEIKL